MTCAFTQPPHPADARITYGYYHRHHDAPFRSLDLCARHRAELWEQIKGPVTAGRMHFAIEDLEPPA